MDYYIAPRRGDRLPQISSPEEIKLFDPACGSGHMLTYAFDLLYPIYEEEGYAPAEIPGRSSPTTSTAWRSAPAPSARRVRPAMKAREPRTFFREAVEPQVCCLEDVVRLR